MLQVTFLGTGTSQGVPMIGCSCEVCQSGDARNNRLRASVAIQWDELSIIVDTGPDFRYQMLRSGIQKIDAVLFTHSHKDHIAGLDDIRAFNYWQQKAIDVFATEETIAALKREFNYIFSDFKYPGIPELNIHEINIEPFTIERKVIIPISVLHYKMEVYGFRFGDFTYITDANYISDLELEKIQGSKVLVLNALRHEPHISHFTLKEALELIEKIQPQQAYLTHISHQLGLHEEINKTLPPHVHLAYDGLIVNV